METIRSKESDHFFRGELFRCDHLISLIASKLRISCTVIFSRDCDTIRKIVWYSLNARLSLLADFMEEGISKMQERVNLRASDVLVSFDFMANLFMVPVKWNEA